MAGVVLLSSGKVMTDPSQLFAELAKRSVRTMRTIDLDQFNNLTAEWEAAASASRSKEVRVYVRLMVEDLRQLLGLVEGDNLEGGI